MRSLVQKKIREDFLSLFSYCRVLWRHCCIVGLWKRKLLRRFEENWASHLECEGVICEAWGMEVPNGSPMFRLFEKIKKL